VRLRLPAWPDGPPGRADLSQRRKRAEHEELLEEPGRRLAQLRLALGDTPHAGRHVMAGDSKRFARVQVMETVIAEIERGCAERGFPLPEPL